MKIEIDLTRDTRKEALKKIDAAINHGATADDLDELIHNLLFQRKKNEGNVNKVLNSCEGYGSLSKEYAIMNDANALVAHCQKIKAKMHEQNVKNKSSFINLEQVELTETTAADYISTIGNAVLARKFNKIDLMAIVRDLKIQMHKLSSTDKAYYDRIELAKQIIEFCNQQLTIFDGGTSLFGATGAKRRV